MTCGIKCKESPIQNHGTMDETFGVLFQHLVALPWDKHRHGCFKHSRRLSLNPILTFVTNKTSGPVSSSAYIKVHNHFTSNEARVRAGPSPSLVLVQVGDAIHIEPDAELPDEHLLFIYHYVLLTVSYSIFLASLRHSAGMTRGSRLSS